MTRSPYGELTAVVDATQIVDDVLAPTPTVDLQITDQFAGGTGILWLLSYQVDRQAPSGLAPKITVNGVPMLVAVDGFNTTCPSYSIIPLSPSIDALITGTAPPPQGGDVIDLTYVYASTAYVRLEDPSPIAAYAETPTLGRFTVAGVSASGLSVSQALALARSQLTQYSTPFVKIDAVLEEDYQGSGFEKLQAVTFTSNRLGLLGLVGLVTAPQWIGTKGTSQQRLSLTIEL